MYKVGRRIIGYIKNIELKTMLLSLTIALAVSYYINPLKNVDLLSWNRTFSSSVLAGISIDARIGNFYKLFLLYLPLLIILVLIALTWLFKKRSKYQDFFTKIGIFLALITVASYISRYTSDATKINENPMIQSIIAYFLLLYAIALIDKQQQLEFSDSILLLLTFFISVTSYTLLFQSDKKTIFMILLGGIIAAGTAGVLYLPIGKKIAGQLKSYLYILMWLPAMIRAALEGIYILTERGRNIARYFTYLCRTALIILVLAVFIVWLIRKKNWNLSAFGYIGAIISYTAIGFFPYNYQYVFSYSSFNNLYELSNDAVAMDTCLYGKLPIVDYFSAHALDDVWTKLVYYLINGDIKGALTDPYAGLSMVVAFIILYFIIKQIFNREIAVLFVLLFPGTLMGIKFTSICCITIAMLLYICRKPSFKNYILFWISALVGALNVYDEGISLGIACIVAFIIACILQKNWKELQKYIVCGISVGSIVLALYVLYALATGIPVIGRIKEWMSVSIGSSSTWATANFGDQTTFAFLFAYFIVPMTAIGLLVYTLIRYIKYKKNLVLTIFTIAFSLTEIIYITRTIVYHNLLEGLGVAGTLFNFVHWTVAAFVLYLLSDKDKHEDTRIFAFVGSLFVVIMFEGIVVTQNWSTTNSSLIARGLNMAEKWNLQDNVTDNQGQKRIVYDQETESLVLSFQSLFDELLTEEQTYLDFSNVTSMYLMTGRTRPCYVGQSPSLLTDLYSQECFIDEIEQNDCPLAVLGTTETMFLQQMIGIPHNVRYYKIAEYIYNNYRPLTAFGEFAVWCRKDSYDAYRSKLIADGFSQKGYELIDYGYDFTTSYTDEGGMTQWNFKPYHFYNLEKIPYIWANYDEYTAIGNAKVADLTKETENRYIFNGSKSVASDIGNYLVFEIANKSEEELALNIVFSDSSNDGAMYQYCFTVEPGTNQYLIRVSEDYFWEAFNIDTVLFEDNDMVTIQKVRILEGD